MSARFQLLQNEHPFPQNEENGYPTLIKFLSPLQDRKNKYQPQLFLLPALFVWNHCKGTVLSRWIGVHQLFQLHNGLSTWEPLRRSSGLWQNLPGALSCYPAEHLRKKASKTQESLCFNRDSFIHIIIFSVLFIFVLYFGSKKKRAKHPKKNNTDTKPASSGDVPLGIFQSSNLVSTFLGFFQPFLCHEKKGPPNRRLSIEVLVVSMTGSL